MKIYVVWSDPAISGSVVIGAFTKKRFAEKLVEIYEEDAYIDAVMLDENIKDLEIDHKKVDR